MYILFNSLIYRYSFPIQWLSIRYFININQLYVSSEFRRIGMTNIYKMYIFCEESISHGCNMVFHIT